MNIIKHVLPILLLSALAVGCATPVSMATPEGFAPSTTTMDLFRAYSPEGVVVEAYRTPNKPNQSLEFWKEAYQFRMEEAGYRALSPLEELEGMVGTIAFGEWLVPFQGQQYVYSQAFAVSNEELIVVEIAGPLDLYQGYRSSLLEAIQTLEP